MNKAMHTPARQLTLVVVHDDARILLGFKKRGFGMGRWNGFGGKVQDGESHQECAARELREECGIEAKNLVECGVLTFDVASDPVPMEVHVFRVTAWQGNHSESEEMRPQWFRHTEIPYGEMWADDKYWLPLVLRGRSVEGRFHFLDNDHLLHHELREKESVTA